MLLKRQGRRIIFPLRRLFSSGGATNSSWGERRRRKQKTRYNGTEMKIERVVLSSASIQGHPLGGQPPDRGTQRESKPYWLPLSPPHAPLTFLNFSVLEPEPHFLPGAGARILWSGSDLL